MKLNFIFYKYLFLFYKDNHIMSQMNQKNVMKQFTVSSLRRLEEQQIPDEFLCPVSQAIMYNPVINLNGQSFEKKDIEQWIDKTGTCPLTRNPLTKADLKPNRALREAIFRYVGNLSQKQKQNLSRLKVQQVVTQREKQIENLRKELEVKQGQLQVQRKKKQAAEIQFKDQKKKAVIEKQKLLKINQQTKAQKLKAATDKKQIIQKYQNQIALLKAKIQPLQQKVSNLINYQKQTKEWKAKSLQQEKKIQAYIEQIEKLKRQLNEARGGQKNREKFESGSNLHLTPDTNTPAWTKKKDYRLEGNIVVYQGNDADWLCSREDFPTEGQFVFSIKARKVEKQMKSDGVYYSCIFIGVMESDFRQKKWKQTLPHAVYLSTEGQRIQMPNKNQTGVQNVKCACQRALPQLPCIIQCRVDRQSNTMSWHYNGKEQARSKLPVSWKEQRKNLCAVVVVWQQGNSVEFM